MNSLLVILDLLLGLATKLVDAWNIKKKRENENDLQSDADKIKADPIAHARDKFGRVPDEPSKASPMRSDSPKQSDD